MCQIPGTESLSILKTTTTTAASATTTTANTTLNNVYSTTHILEKELVDLNHCLFKNKL